MSGTAENLFRPPGFPYSEQEFQDILQLRLAQVAGGEMLNTYDEWVLRGTPREPLDPTVALGVFPTPAQNKDGFVYERVMYAFAPDHRSFPEYWKDIQTLLYSPRAAKYERTYFRELVRQGDKMLKQMTLNFLRDILPSAAMLFGRVAGKPEESAYLISSRFVPPSATFRHIVEQARLYKVLS